MPGNFSFRPSSAIASLSLPSEGTRSERIANSLANSEQVTPQTKDLGHLFLMWTKKTKQAIHMVTQSKRLSLHSSPLHHLMCAKAPLPDLIAMLQALPFQSHRHGAARSAWRRPPLCHTFGCGVQSDPGV